MKDMEELVDKATIDWLLEKSNPSVRYLTLTQLLKKSENDQEVKEAKANIMKIGVVPKILAKQNEDGYWGEADRFYRDKYKGTVWQLIILAELHADKNDSNIKKAIEFILDRSQDLESYGFATDEWKEKDGGRHSMVIPCLTGNIVYSLINLGYFDDERVQKAIMWIIKYQRCDDGIDQHLKGWPYDRFEMCFGKHSCHMGVVKSLKALAIVPLEERGPEINNKIKELVEYLLIHHLYRKSHDLKTTAKPGWLRLEFPLMYQSDILEILDILTDLGYKDKRMEEAIRILIKKQGTNKRWKLDSTFNGRFIENIEEKGQDSKWITFRAIKVLSKYYDIEAKI